VQVRVMGRRNSWLSTAIRTGFFRTKGFGKMQEHREKKTKKSIGENRLKMGGVTLHSLPHRGTFPTGGEKFHWERSGGNLAQQA